MKKRLVFILLLALVLTAFALRVGVVAVNAMDNVTYTLPFMGIHTNSVVYCWAANMSTDNVSVGVSVMSNSVSTAPPSQNIAMLGGMIIYSKQTNMITFTGATATLGSAVADLSQQVGTNSATIYGVNVTFIGSYQGVTTTLLTSGPNTVFGPQVSTNMTTSQGLPTVPANCLTIGMACYQGTTSPKRNLVGYTCMDSINTFIKPISY
ncbi:MAG: hypothetical protein HQK88_01940 [Nitrospirae bacterium]|nr:hypothetical protein [Nitrospirota bacterium]MBF0533733.1 hypothetical protein [Nitrospirota bacterium]MBF0615558.1 hypothetical protein [Nitrospirota bacterium]